MTPFRVLRVITRLNIGGPATHVSLLSARLDPSRFETLLVAGREGIDEGSMVELGRIDDRLQLARVAELGRAISPLTDLRATVAIARIARAFRPHIVHTHLAKAGFVGRIAGRLAGARVVLHTYHGTVFEGYFGKRESALYLAIERGLARITTRIIAITSRQRDDLIALRIAPPEKVVIVPLGLDLEPFLRLPDKDVARAALGLEPSRPVVGLVARLVPIKDVATFIRAIALLRQRRADVQAVIVGDGSERSRLEALGRDLALDGACLFLGWRADTPNVYAAIDVLALSSLSEGSPVSVIEAMASGRPVVATAVGGVPDVVLDGLTGSLVPPRDPAALADALEAVLADPDMRVRYGDAGRAFVYPRHGASRLVRDIEDLYSALLAVPS